MTNADMVSRHFVESFKENLRSVITASAAVLSLDEIRSMTNSVLEETVSFLASSADGDEGQDNG